MTAEGTTLARERLVGTDQQEEFWSEVLRRDGGNLLLSARAGTGKSASCREAMWRLIEESKGVGVSAPPTIRYCCFNKAIADEFREKSPNGVEVGTMHSFGFRACARAFGSKLEKQKTYLILDQLKGGASLPRKRRKAISRLVSIAKNRAFGPAEGEAERDIQYPHFLDLILGYDIDADRAPESVAKWAMDVLVESSRMTNLVDFDDMLWLPAAHDLAFPTIDYLFVDECLPAWTPILLADGTSKPIGEIVDGHLPVEVLSYDTESGRQRPCKVIGWSKTLNRKPLIKIKVRWKRKKGTNRPTNFVVCTIDHKIWADGRWIPAGDVKPGMIMQVETAAAKSQAGKITSRGRLALAESVADRNAEGGMACSPREGAAPTVRGGNGQGPTLPQQLLLEALGDGWVTEHVVTTIPGAITLGYPYHYKIDIAHPTDKIAVEVDGESHAGRRRESDRRKDEFLRACGWKVIRVSNREAVQQTEEVAARILESDCPIGAEVVSIDPVDIPDNHVYDLTVEGCHNFYANGILVHNCQDLNPLQHALLPQLRGGGRAIVVGDPFQAIYGFRGADCNSVDNLKRRLDASEYPLTRTFRCPKSHVDLAAELVPDFEAAEDNPVGTIDGAPLSDLLDVAHAGDLVLCRKNAPLVGACLRAIGSRIPAIMRGRSIGEGLVDLVNAAGTSTTAGLIRGVREWEARQVGALQAKEASDDDIEAVMDRSDCVVSIATECDSVAEVITTIKSLFDDKEHRDRITFSSVHRAKGSEARRVHFVDIPYGKRAAVGRPEALEGQRLNLRYVALTRSLGHLTLVDPGG